MFETLDEIAELLQLDVCPITWPVGMGGTFEGIYDLRTNRLLLPEGPSREFQGKAPDQRPRRSPARRDRFATEPRQAARGCRAGDGGLCRFRDGEAYRDGDLTPVYFDSALKEFGVDSVISALAAHATPPHALLTEPAPVSPDNPQVTGFVFKVQANMDPNHRDHIAFMRLVSGVFKRRMKLTPTGHGKPIAIHSPILFFAQ